MRINFKHHLPTDDYTVLEKMCDKIESDFEELRDYLKREKVAREPIQPLKKFLKNILNYVTSPSLRKMK